VQIAIRDADGSLRVATIERDRNNPRAWVGSVDHPSGEKWSVRTFEADAVAALGQLAQAFASREVDFKESKGRGHKRVTPHRDANVRVDDRGEFIHAPIKGYDR
jgi:hypothetical protein